MDFPAPPSPILPTEPYPTLGRVILFQTTNSDGDSEDHPGLIVWVGQNETINAVVFNPHGEQTCWVNVSKGCASGCWRYPPRA